MFLTILSLTTIDQKSNMMFECSDHKSVILIVTDL